MEKIKATVDRIEGEIAVVTFDGTDTQIDIFMDRIPEGAKEGTKLNLTLEKGTIIEIEVDKEGN